ncbi:MAG TPA: hypothetical protein VNY05_35035 [Candidatus Acidoferrales bacterium]|nr:hypothetical protein [Candidatus Acidoferrales bacterium]
MRKLPLIIGSALFLMLAGCSETPTTTAKKEPEKLEPVTGETALYRMFGMARTWASDAQVLQLMSIRISEFTQEVPGKAAAWQATFVSASKSQSRSYSYSIVESQGNLHKGAFAGPEESWSGPRGVATPFLIAAVKKDSDEAYHTAMSEPKSKAADYDKKSPGKPITILLEKTNKFPDPAWRVVWGESVGTSSFSVFVDASLGTYLETMR